MIVNTPHSEFDDTNPLVASQSKAIEYDGPAASVSRCVMTTPSCAPGRLLSWPARNVAAVLGVSGPAPSISTVEMVPGEPVQLELLTRVQPLRPLSKVRFVNCCATAGRTRLKRMAAGMDWRM